MGLDPEFWTQLLRRIAGDVMSWLPTLAGAVALLVLGWLAARLAQAIIGGLLRRLGLDRLAQKAGAGQILTGAGVGSPVSELIARLVFWLVMLVFLLAVSENLGLQGLAGTMSGLIAYLPRVFAAGFVVLVGSLIARFLGEGVGALAAQSGVRNAPFMGQAAHYLLLAFVAILAIDQLGVSTNLLTGVAIALAGSVALAVAVAFGIGSRDLARNVMAGYHARDEFKVGQRLIVRAHTGRLATLGPVKSVIETDAGRVSIPNAALMEEEVTLLSDGGPGR